MCIFLNRQDNNNTKKNATKRKSVTMKQKKGKRYPILNKIKFGIGKIITYHH